MKPCGTCKISSLCIGEDIEDVARRVVFCVHCKSVIVVTPLYGEEGNSYWSSGGTFPSRNIDVASLSDFHQTKRGTTKTLCKEMKDALWQNPSCQCVCNNRRCHLAERRQQESKSKIGWGQQDETGFRRKMERENSKRTGRKVRR